MKGALSVVLFLYLLEIALLYLRVLVKHPLYLVFLSLVRSFDTNQIVRDYRNFGSKRALAFYHLVLLVRDLLPGLLSKDLLPLEEVIPREVYS